MNIEKSGGWITISQIIGGELIRERYMYYTRAKAVQMFNQKYKKKC